MNSETAELPSLSDALVAASDARSEGLRGKYPAALIVVEAALTVASGEVIPLKAELDDVYAENARLVFAMEVAEQQASYGRTDEAAATLQAALWGRRGPGSKKPNRAAGQEIP